MTADIRPEPSGKADLDESKVDEFAQRLLGTFTEGMLTLMIDLAHQTGLLDALAAGGGTSSDLAARAGLQERYARECLGALVTGDIVDYDTTADTYALPPERAVCLTGAGSQNLAPISQVVTLLGKHVAGVAKVFRDGGGIPYSAYRPEFTTVMDGVSRGFFDGQLIDGLLPLTGDLPRLLTEGIRVADVGCGTGHSTNVLAGAFPRSTFVGYDISEEAIGEARAEAADLGLTNVSFEVVDVATLRPELALDAAFAFDAIHDQVAPAAVLERVHRALVPGGVFVMLDTKAASTLAGNIGNPLAPFLYSVSTLHCMTVSLAHGGAGLGTVWGEQLARRMLGDAGFVDVTVHDVPDDPMDSLYVCH
jgi:SAM-dependent methyltransferase